MSANGSKSSGYNVTTRSKSHFALPLIYLNVRKILRRNSRRLFALLPEVGEEEEALPLLGVHKTKMLLTYKILKLVRFPKDKM